MQSNSFLHTAFLTGSLLVTGLTAIVHPVKSETAKAVPLRHSELVDAGILNHTLACMFRAFEETNNVELHFKGHDEPRANDPYEQRFTSFEAEKDGHFYSMFVREGFQPVTDEHKPYLYDLHADVTGPMTRVWTRYGARNKRGLYELDIGAFISPPGSGNSLYPDTSAETLTTYEYFDPNVDSDGHQNVSVGITTLVDGQEKQTTRSQRRFVPATPEHLRFDKKIRGCGLGG